MRIYCNLYTTLVLQPKLSHTITDRPFNSRQPSLRTRTSNNPATGFLQQTPRGDNTKYNRNQPYQETNKYVTSHESSIRSKNRFQTTGVTTTTRSPITTAATTVHTTVQKSRRNRYFSPKTNASPNYRLTTTPATTTTQLASDASARDNKLLRQTSFKSRTNNNYNKQSQSQNVANSRGNRTWTGRGRGSYANANFNTAAEEETNTPQQRDANDEDEYAYDGGQTLSRQKPSPNQDNDFDDPLINPVSYVKENVHLEESNKTVRKNEDDFKIDSILDETNADEAVPQSDNQPIILTSNFYLPEQSSKNEDENSVNANVNNEEDYADETKSTEQEHPVLVKTEEVTLNPEYEYYDDYEDEATTTSMGINSIVSSSTETVFVHSEPKVVVELNSEPKTNLPDIKLDNDTVLREAVVSVVTTKSVVNGSTSNPDMSTHTEQSQANVGENVESDSTNSSTESWVVVASVQTSRSVSGARFLPFPQVEQEERKQSLAELEASSFEEQETKNLDNDNDEMSPTTLHPSVDGNDEEERADGVEVTESAIEVTTFDEEVGTLSSTQPLDTHTKTTTTEHLVNISTESIIDKLDRVQSELSSDLLSGKFPVINGMAEHVEAHSTSTSGPPVIIRKFTPRTTTTVKPTDKKITFDTLPMDDLSGLLPFGFKPRNTGNYRNKKVTTTKTTAVPDDDNTPKLEIRSRNANISRSFKSKPAVQDTIVPDDLLPKDFKLKSSPSGAGDSKLSDLLSNIKFEDNIEQLLPKDYTHYSADKTVTTNKPTITTSLSGITDDVNKLLPPGFKLFTTTNKPLATVRPSLVTISEDVSKFLPTGYKSYQRNNSKKPPLDVIPISDNASKQFAGGYKSKDTTTTSRPSLGVIPIANDISKFLPPGYKLPAAAEKPVPEVKIADDISKFLPPGYKPTADHKNESDAVADDILSKLLPPGYKRPASEQAAAPKVVVNENLSKLLPPGFQLDETKPRKTDTSLVDSILNKIKFKEPSSLLPVGFVADSIATTTEVVEEATTTRNLSGLKVVFPKGFKRPGVRVTTAKPSHVEGPSKPEITIRKGLPTR